MNKGIRKINTSDIYINVILLVLFCMVGICLVNACQKIDSSWGSIKTNRSGTILLAYVEKDNSIYEDNNGELHGEAVDVLNHFIAHTEDLHQIKILPKFKKFNNSQEVLKRIRFSNGGVFGWNISQTVEKDFHEFSLPYALVDIEDEKISPNHLVLKADSDWVPLLASFLEENANLTSNKPAPENSHSKTETAIGEEESLNTILQ